MAKIYRDLEERLLFSSVLDEHTGCWVWLRNVDRKGYGRIQLHDFARKRSTGRRAHRVAYEVFGGEPLRPDQQVDHTCRNTRCINPAHLEAVSPGINRMRQALALGHDVELDGAIF